MKRIQTVVAVMMILFLVTACAGKADNQADPGQTNIDPAAAVPEPAQENPPDLILDERLRAAAGDEGSVLLNWEPLDNAETYLLEFQVAGSDYLPLAILSGDVNEFEDVDAPADVEMVYRLTVISGGKKGENLITAVKTLALVPDPLKVTLEYDVSIPLYDFSNTDPENYDPSVLMDLFPTDESGEISGDGAAFDPSLFASMPISETVTIGPDGGEVSVTGSNEMVYTLSVPQGALMFEVPVTLKPISAIPDLPLSGGMDAAVMIEPSGIPLLVPATLTIFAPADLALSSGELNLGFAFTDDGEEFHLYPLVEEGAQAGGAVRMAKIAPKPRYAGPLAEIAQQQMDQFMGFGKGSGTKEDVRKVNKRASTKAKHRAAASAAAAKQADKFLMPFEEAFDEELTPLMTPQELALAKLGELVRQKAEKAGNIHQLMDALEEFQVYYQNGGDKYNQKLNDRILDALVKTIHNVFQKNLGKCLAAEDLKAQALVDRLVNGKGAAIKAISTRFKEKYGNQLLEDLYYGRKPCIYELQINSSLSYESDGSVWFTNTVVDPFPLYPLYAAGDLFLLGSGPMKQTQEISGICSAPVSQYEDLKFLAQKLEPEFDNNGLLVDFALTRYFVTGMEQLQRVDVAGEDCMRSVSFAGGGDFWSAFFTMSRATNGHYALRNWEVKGDIVNGSSVTASWESVRGSFNPVGQGGKMSEDSKFKLEIKKIK